MKAKIFFNIRLVSILFLGSAILFSCVPARKYNDSKASLEKYMSDNTALRTEQERLQEQLKNNEEQLQVKTRDVENLRRDTARLMSTLEMEMMKNRQLNQTYELLLQKNKELLADNRYQTEKISAELSLTQEQLIRKEDALKKLEAELLLMQKELNNTEAKLIQKEQSLNAMSTDLVKSREGLDKSVSELEASRKDLMDKQQRLMELQKVLAQKDSMVTALRNTVATALMGFTDKGLKVEERNGKVYVSMENKLLFASGSTAVGTDGQKALTELARVLEANPDINVMVEGHTDDVPLRGSGQMKDNWDLSVLRATEIVRIILSKGKIEPSRITAAGRSQYLPVDPANTNDARARNRRTEIILTPKLDELFKVIESN
jgi:chemotaxis protein MotB